MRNIVEATVEIDAAAARDVFRFESLEETIDEAPMSELDKVLAWMYAWSMLPVEERRKMA